MKSNVKKMNKQATDWGKIFSTRMSKKGLISRIYDKHLQLINKKIKVSQGLEQKSHKNIL